MGGRVGDAGGVWGLKRVANLSMSDSWSVWVLVLDADVDAESEGSGMRDGNELSGVAIIFVSRDDSTCDLDRGGVE
jgi:hypothetical protein